MPSTTEIMKDGPAPAGACQSDTRKRSVRRDGARERGRATTEQPRLPQALCGMSVGQARHISVPADFVARFRERVPSSVSPVIAGRGIAWAIANRREDLFEYLGCTAAPQRRRYRFKTADGHFFVALVDTDMMAPITVLPNEG